MTIGNVNFADNYLSLLSRSLMVYQFENIPIELILYHIGKDLSFYDIANLACSDKNFKSSINELVDIVINNNDIFTIYKEKYGDDIIENIKNSAINIYEFEDTMKAIRNNDISSISFDFNKKYINTSIESINATFKIFQIFQLEAEKSNDEISYTLMNHITNLLLNYFHALFQTRNNVRDYNDSYITPFMLKNTDDNNGWHKIDINIYFLYENYTLIQTSKRSFNLKCYMENNINIVHNEINEQIYNTMRYLMMLMSIGNLQEKVYCFHEIMKLLNYIYSKNTQSNYFLKYKNFTIVCLRKINEFKEYLTANSSELPNYFKKSVFAEFDKFIDITNDPKYHTS